MRSPEQLASWMETVAVINIYVRKRSDEVTAPSDRELENRMKREVEMKSLEVWNSREMI